MFGQTGWGEILVVVLVILLLFGAKRLPELTRSIGRSLSEFKKGMHEEETTVTTAEKPKDEQRPTNPPPA